MEKFKSSYKMRYFFHVTMVLFTPSALYARTTRSATRQSRKITVRGKLQTEIMRTHFVIKADEKNGATS
jgi:hypothetical protein